MDERHRAEEHLRVIRTLMERATIYRAISASTALIGGLIALGLTSTIWASERHWAQIAPQVMRHISTRGFAARLAPSAARQPAFYLALDEAGPSLHSSLSHLSRCNHNLVFLRRVRSRQ